MKLAKILLKPSRSKDNIYFPASIENYWRHKSIYNGEKWQSRSPKILIPNIKQQIETNSPAYDLKAL